MAAPEPSTPPNKLPPSSPSDLKNKNPGDDEGSDGEDMEDEMDSEKAWADMKAAMDTFLETTAASTSAPADALPKDEAKHESTQDVLLELSLTGQEKPETLRRCPAITIEDSPPLLKHGRGQDALAKLLALAQEKQRSMEGFTDRNN